LKLYSIFLMKRSKSDAFPTSEIRSIISEIVQSTLPEKERLIHFEKLYPDFLKHHALLCTMACKGNFDMGHFEYMMQMRDKINNKEETEESASVKVGQVLFNQYVEPVIKE